MTDHSKDAAQIVDLNGGRLVGRTRLQKSAYFLESFGVGFGFDFDYYHYGPYSEELSIAADDAEALELLSLTWKPTSFGNQFAEYISNNAEIEDSEINLKRKNILGYLKNYDSICLELAATADFLSKNGYANDFWEETQKRKSSKASGPRIEKAKALLLELNGASGKA